MIGRRLFLRFARRVMAARLPDVIIGGVEKPYLSRWWVIPRNRIFNIYLHEFWRDDDDRALHDHPWVSVSLILTTGYWEHLARGPIWRAQGAIVARRAVAAHRIALLPGTRPVSLFITGPNIRSWGFHCPKGWVHWRDFTAGPRGEVVGRGCD